LPPPKGGGLVQRLRLTKDRDFLPLNLFGKPTLKYTNYSFLLATRPCFWLGGVSPRLFVFPSKIGRYRGFNVDYNLTIILLSSVIFWLFFLNFNEIFCRAFRLNSNVTQ